MSHIQGLTSVIFVKSNKSIENHYNSLMLRWEKRSKEDFRGMTVTRFSQTKRQHIDARLRRSDRAGGSRVEETLGDDPGWADVQPATLGGQWLWKAS